MITRSTGAVSLGLAAFLAASASAQAKSLDADYILTFLGLTVGKASISSDVSKNRFDITGSFSSAGIARIFERTEAKVAADGTYSSKRIDPRNFRVDYVQNRKPGSIRVQLRGGSVVKTDVTPPPKKGKKDYIQVAASHLKGVVDPLSALIVAPGKGADICKGTVRVFDGETRADLKLSFVKAEKIDGFDGEAITCAASFVPVSGYVAGDDTYEYLRNKGRIVFDYVPVPDLGIYTLLKVSARSPYGTFTMRATRLDIN